MKSALPSALLILLPLFSQAETFVSAETAKSQLFFPQKSAPASVIALNTSVLPAEVGAKLNAINVSVGEFVQKGQVLARLDCRNANHQLQIEKAKTAQIENQLSFDESEFIRGQRLAKQKNIGESDFDRRKTQLGNSRASLSTQNALLSLATLNVARCNVIAPFNGVITKRIASVGSMVDFGKPVLEIVDTETIEISAKISTDDLLTFKNASQYQLTSLSNTHELALKNIVPVIEKNSRSQEARFTVTAETDSVVAGSTGRVIWTSPKPLLPAHLLQVRNGISGYFNVEGTTAKFIPVAGAQEGRPIPFNGNENDILIVDGRFGLNDGDTVNVVASESK